jgi:DNA polymerase, archaea type
MNKLIYGKNDTQSIVGLEIEGEQATLLMADGSQESIPYRYWLLLTERHSPKLVPLEGSLPYKYLVEYTTSKEYYDVINKCKARNYEYFTIYNQRESFMAREGHTFYKGMKPSDLSVLSFDIETNTGLEHTKDSMVLLISTTWRKGNTLHKRLFSYDEFTSQEAMLNEFCSHVCYVDPDVIVGHNLFGYDLPFLQHVANLHKTRLYLGRDVSPIKFDKRTSEFRKDGSQTYTYTDARIWGREIVDTFFLALKSDIGRKYESYGLKAIIKHEGLEKPGRQHYDASKISANYKVAEEWRKIKEYAKDDADDALALFDLMIPGFFYYTQMVPMSLQRIINTATGRQVNALMIRAYLQDGHSLPRATEAEHFEGAISMGNPGVYKHVYKVDVASLYPSIILQHEIKDNAKDPKGLFLDMVKVITEQRLENKRLHKETGERRYKDLSEGQKIVANSFYGFLGANRLLFNCPVNAAKVTEYGRDILKQAITWAECNGYKIVNADTDSISYTNGKKMTDEKFAEDLANLNALFPDLIRWENDGYYKSVIVIRAKNYALEDAKGKITLKGNSLKAPYKEAALREFISETLVLLRKGHKDRLWALYHKYVKEVNTIVLIDRWCSKKTITKSVLAGEATQQARILEAVEDHDVSEGDKVYLFYKQYDELAKRETFDGTYDKDRLFEKLYATLCIFDSLIDVEIFPNYALKRNKGQIDENVQLDFDNAS